MIESLRIENLAIVEEAEIEFDRGLNVLTGETGTGKSIVLGALSLLVGARGDAGKLREGADQGCVEALFRTDALQALERDLIARGLLSDPSEESGVDDEPGLGHELIVRRTLSSAGRSRARVAGQLVPIATLSELFSGRIEISSQHSSQALLHPESHARYLDAAGGLMPVRDQVQRAYDAVRDLDSELARLREQAEERVRRQDFLAFQVSEIDEVGLSPGEGARLTSEHAKLAHAENLCGDGGAAATALRGDDMGDGTARGAADAVALALRHVEDMARLDPALTELAERLQSADMELRDIAADLERYVDGVEGDPARLIVIEERISQLERLRRKYGQTEEEILEHRQQTVAELEAIEGADTRIAAIASERSERLLELADAARRLSAGRAKAGRKLGKQVQKSLRELAMPSACFEVALEPAANLASLPEGMVSGPAGAEAPEFRFSANQGESPRSLQKVASGGELSRVFLAVKNALRPFGANMVLVFDEVDTGIGGRAADRVGRVLAELASEHQVLCITHLPQIAAYADAHFRVEKSEKKGRARVRIERIDAEMRIEEIARMAGGDEVTESTRRHARDLLRAKTRK